MNKNLMAAAIVFFSSSAMADQKTPITPSLPAHVGSDFEGNKVIHNAPNQPSQQEEQDGAESDTNSKRQKNRHK
jgi:hypothetical protein